VNTTFMKLKKSQVTHNPNWIKIEESDDNISLYFNN